MPRQPVPPVPKLSPITDDLTPAQFRPTMVFISDSWFRWLTPLREAINRAAQRINSTPLELQDATVPSTVLNTGTLTTGLYRVSYLARVITPGSVSSSLTVAFGWVSGGVAQTFTGAAMTGNTTTTYQQASVLMWVDADTDITYSATYASVGGTDMVYDLQIVVEALG